MFVRCCHLVGGKRADEMHREGLRRSLRTIIGREWSGGSRWNRRKEISEEYTNFSPSNVIHEDPGFRASLWIARGGTTTTVDWRNAFSLYHGSKTGVMPGVSVRHFAAPLVCSLFHRSFWITNSLTSSVSVLLVQCDKVPE